MLDKLIDGAKPKTGTRVVNLRHEDYDVFIGRPSKWGNPFIIGRDGSRKECVDKYRAYVRNNPKLMASLPELRGKRLGCYCSPRSCHGDVLVELVEELVN